MARKVTHSAPVSRCRADASNAIARSGGQLFDETRLRAEILSLFEEAQPQEARRHRMRFTKLLPEDFPEYGRRVVPTVRNSEILDIHAQLFEEFKRTA